MAWLRTGMAKIAPAEMAVAMAKVLIFNIIRSSFFLSLRPSKLRCPLAKSVYGR
jgi:hypothetical protein